MAKLQLKSIIKTRTGEDIFIKDVLGEGGQGIVYRVEYNNAEYALKWYSKGIESNSDKFYKNLEKNIKKGSPANTFLWPLELTEKDENNCFGYLMKLRPSEYVDFDKFLLNRVQFKSFEAIINAALQITASFRLLHNKGFSYQDLNDGNFFINPENGDVLICDNDNVGADGDNLGIQGKPKYMAPEVVALNKKPDTLSDRFSLAVILFLLFFKGHPLTGKADDNKQDPAKNELNLYCKNPVFIFDPKDSSNRPDPEIHKNPLLFWPVYPSGIRLLFIKAFNKALIQCDGGPERENRIIEKQWLKELVQLRTQIVKVNGEETFFDAEDEEHIDMNTGLPFSLPPLLQLGKFTIPLQPEKKIYSYEINDLEVDLSEINNISGEVIVNKKNSSVWGLKNLTDEKWIKKTPSGMEEEIEPGKVVPVARGIEIVFPSGITGKIV